jgi:multicomponent Na+:H+ antiporter subunit G
MIAAGFVLAACGSLLLVVAAAGLFLLPDALARQHAATKGGTLALCAILIGTALVGGDAAWWWRVGVIVPLLFVTLPVASHMLARAAAREQYSERELAAAPDVEPDVAARR